MMSDFAYKKPDWMKVLNNWRSKTKDLLENEFNPINEDRLEIIDKMRGIANVAKYSNKDPKLEFLKKTSVNPYTGKKSRVVTGIAEIPRKSAKQIEVDYLVGNPLGEYDDRFKGALSSLDKKVGQRKILIKGINEDVENMYKKKFGDRKI